MFRRFPHVLAVAAAAVSFSLLAISAAVSGPLTGVKPLKDAADSIASSRVIEVAGCHANAQHHMVYLWGKKAWHRHGPNCAPLPVVVAPPKHCHKSYQKHHHFGRGSQWHRHAGPDCHWSKGAVGKGPGVGCIKIGAVWICG